MGCILFCSQVTENHITNRLRGTCMKKKITIISSAVILCLMLIFAVGWKIYQTNERNQKGILLAFDDASTDSWETAFDLFDKYDVDVTFFVSTPEVLPFFDKALKRGHEIGFHTRVHTNLVQNPDLLYSEAIEPLKKFHKAGYHITSFAYPYGAYEDWMNVELLKYYDTVRGAYHYRGAYKKDVKKGFIESYSIDNLHFTSDEEFRAEIIEMLDGLCGCDDGTIVSVYSHAVGSGDWSITPERLEILFQEAEKRDLEFYTFQELQ